MSTLVYPPIPAHDLAKAEEDTRTKELEWLLSSLQETLQSLKSGLEECAGLLAPTEPGSTLVLSSLRSENLKGFITRVGTRIVKGDIYLRLPSLIPPRGQNAYKLSLSSLPTASTIVLEQLTTTRTLINACLDVVDATRWTGDAHNANFISGQLRLLHDNIQEAKSALKGWTEGQKTWHEASLPADTFNPPLPDTISFHLSVSEAAVLLNVRTLETAYPVTGTNTPLSLNSAGASQQSYSGFSLREKLAGALGVGRQVFHDEAHEVFTYKGQDVRVRDKVRVESQDPCLMSAMAKLGALERSVALWGGRGRRVERKTSVPANPYSIGRLLQMSRPFDMLACDYDNLIQMWSGANRLGFWNFAAARVIDKRDRRACRLRKVDYQFAIRAGSTTTRSRSPQRQYHATLITVRTRDKRLYILSIRLVLKPPAPRPHSPFRLSTHAATMTPALLTAIDSTSHIHLIIGSNPLAGARCSRSLEVGAKPILIAPESENMHYNLLKRIEEHKIEWIKREFQDDDLKTLGREEVDNVVDAVFVTSNSKGPVAAHISSLCRRLRIPVNVTDSQNLSTFTILSTHTSGPLQVGITTSGKGCKLASRIRREIASSLPPDLGDAVERLGTVRRRIWEQDHAEAEEAGFDVEDEDAGQSSTFNKLVNPFDAEAAKARRMRWLSQICEYWPLRRLAAITDADVDAILEAYKQETAQPTSEEKPILTPSTLDSRRRKGRIILAGSGPGHPDLLTTATLKAIKSAHLILADKLVPAPVLDLVPRRTPVQIARKFPGNADQAQAELHQAGLAALEQGKTVLRLKQGDPYLYGRGAEEVAFFREHGWEATVLPGITSSLSAPLFAQIPVTHRSVSDQVLICTGTGRKGAAPSPPPYLPNQTVVFLMALHRLSDLISSLTGIKDAPYPLETPCAVVERASCADQRVIRTTLGEVVQAVEEEGSRPPGLLVVGWACGVLEREKDRGRRWAVEEGFAGLEGLEGLEGVDALGEEAVKGLGIVEDTKQALSNKQGDGLGAVGTVNGATA
ncbi:uroporphyrin-III C-methyltransferase [Saxophila tyrrhenica]|uniref:Uroporphyrin-III C-methyltransferase n=1 Tax=Saxophila tyrrhenica TaxID=1690608 RepID=A0AAV9NZY5_9PEZI|nr:uroporphyrin-III C-methyltransferase [Saxophila tyrrhenica]